MESKSFKRESQFELLKNDLEAVRLFIPANELQSMLLQIELMFSEIDLFQNKEELEENVDPIETLQGNLIGILNPAEPAKWHAVLSLFILNRIQELNLENNSKLVELAFKSLNLSKNYSEQAEQQLRAGKRKDKQRRSEEGKESNKKRHEPLDTLKTAAFKEYEPAIRLIQLKNQTAAAKTIITYTSIAKIVYPKIKHLNRDKRGRRVIGLKTKTKTKSKLTKSLARIFEIAVAEKKLKSPIYYRKTILS